MINKNKLGLTFGIFAALCHLVWSIAVAMNIQRFVDWILLLHSISLDLTLTSVVILNVAILVILTFVGGYIFGWVLGAVWNFVNKK